MDKISVSENRDNLLKAMPKIQNYISTFRSINKRWSGTITTAMIETGHMEDKVSRLFGPLIKEMNSTTTKYGEIQEKLVDAIIFEMIKKVVSEISDAAKFAINILKRNLFERTADVGYLAIDAEIVDFLKLVNNNDDLSIVKQRADFVKNRLADYQYEYTVYNEIIILDVDGKVQANLDKNNNIIFSNDPLIETTQKIDLHNDLEEDKYIETFRPTDLRPDHGNVLVYSQKIEDPETKTSLGTLCLCFDFEDEMDSIFKDLKEGNDDMIVAILDEYGTVMSSNDTRTLPLSANIPIDLKSEFKIENFNGKPYIYNIAATDGYQGFYGLTWYGLTMIEAETAFNNQQSNDMLDKNTLQKLQNFSSDLSAIKDQSEDLLDDMKIDSINGQINAAKSDAAAFVEILRFIERIGSEIDGLFNSAVENLQQTVVTSLFNDVQFRAFQGNNIADRNLYERANDVCWWALTPMFRTLLTKHSQESLTESDCTALTSNLQYINNLYTPYLRLVLADVNGVVIATSNPPDELEERFINSNLPKDQEFVGIQLDRALVSTALGLNSSKDYCVSTFQQTSLYGGRSTYIYSTCVRDSEYDNRPVGVIQIVFDSEPQFNAMLLDVLPKNENKEIADRCFGVFVDRNKTIISSTNPEYAVGSKLKLDDCYFKYEKGERASSVVELDSFSYALGIQVSNGYREFKQVDGYVNDVICMIFIPL